jgi:hypothetical protein
MAELIMAELIGSSPELLKIARALKLVKGDINQATSILQVQEKQLEVTTERVNIKRSKSTASGRVTR